MSGLRTGIAAALIGMALAGLARPAWTQEDAAPTETMNKARSDFREDDAGLVREVRLALVCYGGSSLAIYIHGNTKEIFRLVQASKALQQDANANHGAMRNAVAANKKTDLEPGEFGQKLTGSAQEWYKRLLEIWISDPRKVRTRVVVDVIAGTSAGGINGVILAKALAHDLPVDKLTELWLNKASLAKLTNGYFGLLRVLIGHAPVDGDALAGWLFEALNGMDSYDLKRGRTPSLLPGGDQLDLFVTTTDRFGYPQNLIVGEPASAVEKRNRHVLHFIYPGVNYGCDPKNPPPRGLVDHFCPLWTPSLAFAARASSSIPGVFPPLNLEDTMSTLAKVAAPGPPPAGIVAQPPLGQVVHSFFRNYELQEKDEKGTFAINTYFVDGGVLDNHPFGPAIEAILSRPQDQEVRRYLVYLQPDPGTPPAAQEEKVRNPGLLKTIWAGLSGIPSGQPILDNLNDVAAHNAGLSRIREIVQAEDRAARNAERAGSSTGDCDHLSELPIAQRFGCSLGVCPGSLDEALRRANQSQLRMVRQAMEKAAETGFVDKELADREFVEKDLANKELADQANAQKSCFTEQGTKKRQAAAAEGLDAPGRSYINLRVQSVLQQFVAVIASRGVCDYPEESAHRALLAMIIQGWAQSGSEKLLEKPQDPLGQGPPPDDLATQQVLLANQRRFLEDFDIGYQRRQLRFVIDWINEQYKKQPEAEKRKLLDELKTAAADRVENLTQLVLGTAENPNLQRHLGSLAPLLCQLRPWQVKDNRTVPLDEQAGAFLANPENLKALSTLRDQLGKVMNELQQKERDASFMKFQELSPRLTVDERREILVRYLAFPFWDRQIYPYVAFSDVGEFRDINIYRLSPDDARLLGSLTAAKKLSGSKVAHFGAFLTREGRESDYLWGRLDAGDRLLAMLKLGPAGAKDLFEAIVKEERAVQPKPLIRESILKEREADIKTHFPN
ncbi:MAG TPA: patatin-like protein [Thermoanaerobaculia bacterium]|jgi:predicted acylesterase/phospholipase RssA|nr:patatin-like protein [Thermoanaerobaculia bacterium]